MEKISRRAFSLELMAPLFTISLIKILCKADLLANPVKYVAGKWLIAMEEISKGLREQKLKPIEWQEQIESLLSHVELKDLMAAIDYSRLAKTAVFPDDHESAEEVNFSPVAAMPSELSFAPYFYAMKKGVAIVPHGHRNMTSMHMMLHGQAHLWHFERVSDEKQYLLIKQTKDHMLNPGQLSTISDQRDNIHWFKALTDSVFMFNIGVFGINPSASFTGREYVDPLHGEKLSDGLIRARRLERDEAYKLYGRS